MDTNRSLSKNKRTRIGYQALKKLKKSIGSQRIKDEQPLEKNQNKKFWWVLFDCSENVISLERDDNFSLCRSGYPTGKMGKKSHLIRNTKFLNSSLEPRNRNLSARGETMRNWVVSREVDEAWLVGTIIRMTDAKTYRKILKMIYKERERRMYESMR